MKTTVGRLKKLINEGLLVEVPVSSHMRKPQFGLDTAAGGAYKSVPFDLAVHNVSDVMWAVMDEFEGVAADLGVDDVRDEAFIGYIGDMLVDRGVPREVIDQVKAKLAKGQTR